MSYLSRMTSVVRRAPRGIGQSLGINELRPLVAKMVVMTERAGTLLSLESSRCHSTSSCWRTVRMTKRGSDWQAWTSEELPLPMVWPAIFPDISARSASAGGVWSGAGVGMLGSSSRDFAIASRTARASLAGSMTVQAAIAATLLRTGLEKNELTKQVKQKDRAVMSLRTAIAAFLLCRSLWCL